MESFAYVDFDDERLEGLQTYQLNDVLEVLYKIYGDFRYIFLDEIQNVDGWPLFVNRLLRTRLHVVLTGSNAKLLSNDLKTILLVHLIRRCHLEGWDVYYLKDRSGECDFVVCNGNRVLQCIQVSYDISKEKTRKREINGLLLANRQTQCTDLILLTDHEYEDVEVGENIISIRPVYEWACS